MMALGVPFATAWGSRYPSQMARTRCAETSVPSTESMPRNSVARSPSSALGPELIRVNVVGW